MVFAVLICSLVLAPEDTSSGIALIDEARVALHKGDRANAIKKYKKAIAAISENGVVRGLALAGVGECQVANGDYADAILWFRRARKAVGTGRQDLSDHIQDRILFALILDEKLAEAQTEARETVEMIETEGGKANTRLVRPLLRLADVIWSTAGREPSELVVQRAFAIAEQNLGLAHRSMIDVLWRIAVIVADRGHLERADVLLGLLAAVEREKGYPVSQSEVLPNLASVFAGQGKWEEAVRILSRTKPRLLTYYDHGHHRVIRCRKSLARYLLKIDRVKEARAEIRVLTEGGHLSSREAQEFASRVQFRAGKLESAMNLAKTLTAESRSVWNRGALTLLVAQIADGQNDVELAAKSHDRSKKLFMAGGGWIPIPVLKGHVEFLRRRKLDANAAVSELDRAIEASDVRRDAAVEWLKRFPRARD